MLSAQAALPLIQIFAIITFILILCDVAHGPLIETLSCLVRFCAHQDHPNEGFINQQKQDFES